MEDYKVVFSELFFPDLTEEEVHWVSTVLSLDATKHAATLTEHLPGADLKYGWPGFVGSILENSTTGALCLWLRSDESFSPGNVVALLRAFQHVFRPTEVVSFTWAGSCSRPVAGQFGGGWAAVSATQVIFGDTWSSSLEAAEKLRGE